MLIASTLAFVIIAPVVVLYAMGYRSPFWVESQLVGVLQIEAIPPSVQISVDEKARGASPRFISNLKPGNIVVSLTKEGYQPWSKNLLVEPGKAIELRGVRLFPQTPDMRTFAQGIQTMSLSPNRLLVAAVNGTNVLQVISQETEETVHTIQLQNSPTSLLWSSDSAYILVGYVDGRYDLVDIAQKESPLVRLPALTGVTQPSWDSRVSGRLLVVRPNNDLVAVSVTNGSERILANDVQSFAVSARQLYVVTTTNEIHTHRLQGGFVSNLVSGTPENIQRLYVTPGDDIAVLFEDSSVALLSHMGELKEVFATSLSLAWSPDGSMLLAQPNHNELYVYNVDNERLYHIPLEQQHLVVRLSRSITHPQWYAGGQHVIYQVDDEIIITEIDTRDRPVSYTVDTTNRGDAQVAVGEDGNILYYLKQTEQTSELVAATMLIEADQE